MIKRFLNSPYFQVLIDEHRKWLGEFNGKHLTAWNDHLANNIETALSEACVRRMLQSKSVQVQPAEGHNDINGGPDFLCNCASGDEFYVEATNISAIKADQETGFKVNSREASRFTSLNRLIFEACDGKEKQCKVRRAPVLLAIATFSGSSIMAFSPNYPIQLITGTIEHTVHFSPGSNTSIGETKSTNLTHSAFLVFDPDGIIHTRAAIAGLILYGAPEGIIAGVLNPFATYPFNSSWIPGIHFETAEIDNDSLQILLNPKRK